MIIQCKSCSRKFLVKDRDIPQEGRMVQCGYCSQKWFQTPIKIKSSIKSKKNKIVSEIQLEASDGYTYKYLGNQWGQLLPSGKIGMLAKKNISKELNKQAGIAKTKKSSKKTQEVKIESISKIIDPSSEEFVDSKVKSKEQLPDVYRPKKKLGFFGYIFLLAIISFSIVGILKTFQKELLMYLPEAEYIFETFDNMIIIVKDLIKSY